MEIKIAVGMIIFNGDYVLKECIRNIYPHVEQILIAEGPVKYWQDQGYSTSSDETNEVLDSIEDPDNKIKIIHGQFKEKDDQCSAYIPYLRDDINYLWNIDCDEIFKSKDVEKLKEILKIYYFTSVGFKSISFYGGFSHYLTGFEQGVEFIRMHRVYPGSYWKTHRPPTIAHKVSNVLPSHHLNGHELFDQTGIGMYHYSYVFPDQVFQKVSYYKAAVSKDQCIDDYFERIYLPWVRFPSQREKIEEKFQGVHEFKPEVRGNCYTSSFAGSHPLIIDDGMKELKEKFNKQMEKYI